ncbi:glycoside hydrolase superfamily, partial [Cristinia sonorae]
TIDIGDGWAWKEREVTDGDGSLEEDFTSQGGWTTVSSFPSEIHLELLKVGRIPDPFLSFNEHDVQCKEWLYRCVFSYPLHNSMDGLFTELVFEGLDTFCDVYLNGKLILEADNMFRTYVVCDSIVQVPSTGLTPSSQESTLLLHFKSAKVIAKKLEGKYGRVRAGSTNLGDPSRVYVRKAQYDWRWDWGPELMTCGPYRPIRLRTYKARLATVAPYALVSPAPLLTPSFRLDVELAGDISTVRALRCVVRDTKTGLIVKDQRVQLDVSESKISNAVIFDDIGDAVTLWWPTGYGDQQLYIVEVTLLGDGEVALDYSEQRVGFRRIELIQEPLTTADRYGTGTTFLFEVNGVRMFMGGSNWIPADNFLTRITAERYRDWVTLLRDGNQNMIRVWGGGIYEPDVFYDICDELGILVWQDFQFACGVYPAHDAFLESVKREAEDNIKRLRSHASLALFCGNNEDYQMVLQWGDVPELPARVIYEDLLPTLVSNLSTTSPPTPYHRGSPYGGEGWDTADPTVGDIHQWEIWGGKERPYQEYWRMGGRFVSEFGIPAMPDIKTIDYWLDGDQKERRVQSKLMSQHCRAGAHDRRFAIVMCETFRPTTKLEVYAYNTQIMQSEAIGLAYRSWRREWRGEGKQFCGGVLVWQLNDCWPVTSWSLVDYFLRPKPAYYTVARELQPITVGIFRTVTKNRDNDRPVQFYEFGAFQSKDATIDLWGTNSTLTERTAKLELRCFDLESEWTHVETHDVVLLPNQTTELLSIACPEPLPHGDYGSTRAHTTRSHSVVVHARLIDSDTGGVIARYSDWPQPYRFIDFPARWKDIHVHAVGERVTISVDKPVKSLVLSARSASNGEVVGRDKDKVAWSDNNLDLVPGDPQTITVRGGEGMRFEMSMMTLDEKESWVCSVD